MLLIVSRSKFVRMNESVNERLSLSIKEYLALKKRTYWGHYLHIQIYLRYL